MGKSAFTSFFSGTMGFLFALLVFFVGLPILICSGCFGTLAFVGSQIEEEQQNNSTTINRPPSPAEKNTANSNDSSKANPSDQSEKENGQRTWVSLLKESGKGSKKTVSFKVTGSNTTLQYAYRDSSGIGASIFQVAVHKASTDEIADFSAVNESSESNSDQTRLRLNPGTYYLAINAANCDWNLEVSEYLDSSDERARILIEEENLAQKEKQKLKDTQREDKAKEIIARRKTVEKKIANLKEELKDLENNVKRPLRTWKSKDGTYSISASFVDSKEYKTVTLRKETGELLDVERKQLCNDDLVYLAKTKKDDDAIAKKLNELPNTIKMLTDELKTLSK